MAVDHYENFPVASLLLPSRFRDPVALVYRFAREADDFADEGDDAPETRLARLAAYRSQLVTIGCGITPADPLFKGIAGIVREHNLPLPLFADLLDAFSQDVVKNRYASFSEVLDYCRLSANPVGRLLLHLFGRATPENLAASDSVCSALQLVNFWQDVELDYAKGRIYLPQDEMQRYGVTERHIQERRCDGAWRALIAFQIGRARAMLRAGDPLGRALPGRIGLEIRATVEGGLRILEKLERAKGDVFRGRPVLKWFDWPLLLARAL
ncbi:MAG TPA: squalene synthase HpnC [Burkholderiales bacterium]|nr:squalene synthase HpnC [Burkholderiales bacterium]